MWLFKWICIVLIVILCCSVEQYPLTNATVQMASIPQTTANARHAKLRKTSQWMGLRYWLTANAPMDMYNMANMLETLKMQDSEFDLNISDVGFFGYTLLGEAILRDNPIVMLLLLKYGAKTALANTDGAILPPFHFAALHGAEKCLKKLITLAKPSLHIEIYNVGDLTFAKHKVPCMMYIDSDSIEFDVNHYVHMDLFFTGRPVDAAISRLHMNALLTLLKGGARIDVFEPLANATLFYTEKDHDLKRNLAKPNPHDTLFYSSPLRPSGRSSHMVLSRKSFPFIHRDPSLVKPVLISVVGKLVFNTLSFSVFELYFETVLKLKDYSITTLVYQSPFFNLNVFQLSALVRNHRSTEMLLELYGKAFVGSPWRCLPQIPIAFSHFGNGINVPLLHVLVSDILGSEPLEEYLATFYKHDVLQIDIHCYYSMLSQQDEFGLSAFDWAMAAENIETADRFRKKYFWVHRNPLVPRSTEALDMSLETMHLNSHQVPATVLDAAEWVFQKAAYLDFLIEHACHGVWTRIEFESLQERLYLILSQQPAVFQHAWMNVQHVARLQNVFKLRKITPEQIPRLMLQFHSIAQKAEKDILETLCPNQVSAKYEPLDSESIRWVYQALHLFKSQFRVELSGSSDGWIPSGRYLYTFDQYTSFASGAPGAVYSKKQSFLYIVKEMRRLFQVRGSTPADEKKLTNVTQFQRAFNVLLG